MTGFMSLLLRAFRARTPAGPKSGRKTHHTARAHPRVEELETRVVPASDVEWIPGEPGQTVTARFAHLSQDAGSANEMGLFLVDNAEGRIGNLKPGDRGYAAAALSRARRKVIFPFGQGPGKARRVDLPGGRFFGMYLVQNGTAREFLAHNRANQPGMAPLVFFSIPKANPDHLEHLHRLPGHRHAWENGISGGDQDFNDLIYSWHHGKPSGTPLIPPFTPPAPPAPPLLDTTSPVITAHLPNDTAPGNTTNSDGITFDPAIAGTVTDPDDPVAGFRAGFDTTAVQNFGDVSADFRPDGTFAFDRLRLDQINGGSLPDGTHTLHLVAQDAHGNVSGVFDVSFTLDTQPPTVGIQSPSPGTTTDRNPTLAGQVTDSTSGVALLKAGVDTEEPGSVPFGAGQFQFTTALALDGSANGPHTVHLQATDAAGNVSSVTDFAFTLDTTAVPDPGSVAPPLSTTAMTSLADATAFLYTGSSPIQTGVAPGTIDVQRAAVLRGRVTDQAGVGLRDVTITVLGHPEFGSTRTRSDGMFDLAVNGGGSLTVVYDKPGYLEVQRQINNVPWQDYAWLPDVTLVPADTQVTTIDLTAGVPMQVAQGSPITDSDGTREATLLFPQGTTAEMVMPDGSTQPLTTLHVRATEYTVGASGPQAMPAELPPTSAYTYAVELSADEAVAAGATEVTFSQALPFYVENFLNFPVGGAVPSGYYDRQRGVWVPSDNGRVIEVVSESGGLADLDTDGNGTADDAAALAALGITDAERASLATLYAPGQELWRVPVAHFTPWDCNWPYVPPPDADPPDQPPENNRPEKDADVDCGSLIEIQNQVLGESLAVPGTPYTLNYRTDRAPAYTNSMVIPLTGADVGTIQVPGANPVRDITLTIEVAGRQFVQTFSPGPNLSNTFVWDGKDAYGRPVQGAQPVRVSVTYGFGAVYGQSWAFARAFGQYPAGVSLTANSTRQEIYMTQTWTATLGGWDARGAGLGGWTLDVQQTYDPVAQELHLGDGSRRAGADIGTILTVAAGTGALGYSGDGGLATEANLAGPGGIAIAADGSRYIADTGNNVIRRVGPDGIIRTVAGTGSSGGYNGDNRPATTAQLNQPATIALGPDGSLYIADTYNHRVRRVGPDGIITTVAGTGQGGYNGDNMPATSAELKYPTGLAVGPDGSIYIADSSDQRVRRVGPDGIITTVAGTGAAGFGGDGSAAAQAILSSPASVALGPDGSIYIADQGNHRVRRVAPDGIITTVAGNGTAIPMSGVGGLATQAAIANPTGVVVAPDGRLYFTSSYGGSGEYLPARRVFEVGLDGILTVVAGATDDGYAVWGGSAYRIIPSYYLHAPALGPDGTLYFATSHWILQVTPPRPSVSSGEVVIPSEDSSELYVFSPSGQHLRTLDALTGAVLYRFTYDGTGRLTQVEDVAGSVTQIERDAAGNPTALVAPHGQRTALTLDGNGYLASVTDPAGQATLLTYTRDGLLTALTDPRGETYHYAYNALGRLTREDDPAGGFKTFEGTSQAQGYTVAETTPRGTTIYQVENLPTGEQRRITTVPGIGSPVVTLIGNDGSRTITAPDGTIARVVYGPDPRFGMQAPVTSSLTVTTPAGKTLALAETRSVTLANANDPLSLTTLTDTVTVNGKAYTVTYNAAQHTLTGRTPEGRQTVTTLDAQGRVIGLQLPDQDLVQIAYDSQGRPQTFTQGTWAQTWSYDLQGNPTSVINALGQTVQFGDYDPAGRVGSETFPDGSEIRFSYDANGNITAVTPPGQPATEFTYDPVGRIAQYIPPAVAGSGTNLTQYAYYSCGLLSQIARPDGTTLALTYDLAGRLTAFTQPGGTTSLTYDPASGKLVTVTAPDGGAVSYGYDGLLPTDTTWAGSIAGSVHRTYDNNLRVTSVSVNGAQAINYQYDQDGWLTGAGDLTLTRDAQSGWLTGTTLGRVTDAFTFNTIGRLASYGASLDSDALFSGALTFDDLGRITTKTETVDGLTHNYEYTYDLQGGLTDVRTDGVLTAHYAYDANGNRLAWTSPAGTINGSYDDQDRLLSYGTTSYTYTANGELQSKTDSATGQTTTYTYDALGNLMAVTLPDGRQIEYVTDGLNRRIGVRVDGALVQGFLYGDSLRPVAELDGSNTVVSRFVYASRSNVPDYMVRGGKTYRIISDNLGSVRMVIDTATGEVVQRLDYDEFGRVVLDTNPGFQPFGFAGGLYDRNTKLVRFGARDYDAEAGRWTTKDPVGFNSGSTNLYGYVFNEPTNLVDPRGTKPTGCMEDDPTNPRLPRPPRRPILDFPPEEWVPDVPEWDMPEDMPDIPPDAEKALEEALKALKEAQKALDETMRALEEINRWGTNLTVGAALGLGLLSIPGAAPLLAPAAAAL